MYYLSQTTENWLTFLIKNAKNTLVPVSKMFNISCFFVFYDSKLHFGCLELFNGQNI